MNNKMKKLPKGIPTFQELIEDNYIYVDKTKDVYTLLKNDKLNFLSRPRRFGKSLLLSTIEEIFKGNKELFKDLYIYDKWDWNDIYPVLSMDMSGYKEGSVQEFINDKINRVSYRFKIKLESKSLNQRFAELIEKIHNFHDKKVVILIDEYDSPILSNLNDPEFVEDTQKLLNGVYSAIKENDRFIKFVLVTGISKFSKVSAFSALNHLTDITLSENYSCICGYTQKELETYFNGYIEELADHRQYSYENALDNIKFWYDGYSWDGENNLYNPYSTILLFYDKKFIDHWFETGTPRFLIDFASHVKDISPILEPSIMYKDDLDNFDPLNIEETTLLFQAGYLTIKNIDKTYDEYEYELYLPNYEVEKALTKNLVKTYTQLPIKKLISARKKFWKQVNAGDCEGLKETIMEYLIPIANKQRGQNENFYHALIFKWLTSLGFEGYSNPPTYIGEMDVVLDKTDPIIIIEFKQSKTSSIEYMINEAFNQMNKKQYEKLYKGKNIIKMALVFKNDEIGCKIEKNF
ncbi:MAG: ATP-binding protein [Methanobrevibacter sp.]|jgi:Holliday junction resolvase-like predicted endonuclease|nr:ATP-binding protein [Candidatus Methanoflexus mossambicus]